MAINKTISGILANNRTTTGRDFTKLPAAPCLTLLFIKITGGTASIDIEVSDDSLAQTFWPIQTVTEEEPLQVVRVSIPAGLVATNVTSISGATVKIWFRILVLDNVPDSVIDTFEEGDVRARRIVINAPIEVDALVPTRKKLAQAEATTTAAAIYTVAASTQAVVKTIFVVNTDSNPHTIEMWHDGSADVNKILPATTLLAGGFGVFSGEHSMEAADTLLVKADAEGVITVTVSGEEQDVPA